MVKNLWFHSENACIKRSSGNVECNLDIRTENILAKVPNVFTQTPKLIEKDSKKEPFSGDVECNFDECDDNLLPKLR